MITNFLKIFSVLFVFCGMSGAYAKVEANAIMGKWWTAEKDAQIEIYTDSGKYNGRISWVLPENLEKLDDKNPDKEKRQQKILGLEMLKSFSFKKDSWVDGTIYDPKSGKTYSCKMTLDHEDHNKLKIRGYIGTPLLGRTEIFTRVVN